ncbi:unnamed protein product [Prunus armeniaca]|uniref:Uncharacterized protein n=1 Tax=Prunus armeniaca TaxID=36596 RepID=A0A6J5TI52_PRUAR|nr:unnamed protein product [Prunus armeniaca]
MAMPNHAMSYFKLPVSLEHLPPQGLSLRQGQARAATIHRDASADVSQLGLQPGQDLPLGLLGHVGPTTKPGYGPCAGAVSGCLWQPFPRAGLLEMLLCKEIEGEIAPFWWKNGADRKPIHWVGWKQLSRLKKDVLQDKYYSGMGFLEVHLGRKVSCGWRGIMQSRQILEAGLRWRLGIGERSRVTLDPWLPTPHTFKTQSEHPHLPPMVADMIDADLKTWRVRSGYELALFLKRNGELGVKGMANVAGRIVMLQFGKAFGVYASHLKFVCLFGRLAGMLWMSDIIW